MMDKKKYIQIINKYLTCDKHKRQEICKELETDIDEALENGESWTEIVERLGDPQKVANEFNDNLGMPHKSYKKMIIVGILLVIVGLIVAGIFYIKSKTIEEQPLGTSQIFEKTKVEASAQQVIDYLNHDQYDQLYDMSDDIMKKSMSKDTLNQAIEDLGELGEFQNISTQKYVEVVQGGHTSVVGDVMAIYEKRTVIYRVSFNEKMQLSGLYMR